MMWTKLSTSLIDLVYGSKGTRQLGTRKGKYKEIHDKL